LSDCCFLLIMAIYSVVYAKWGRVTPNWKARTWYITEDVYYEIIRKDCYSLIAACCALAQSVIEDVVQVENMRKFGELIGMAFQIKDDLLIIQKMPLVPTGIDIKEQKMTLPLFILNTCTSKRKHGLSILLKP
jgi:octaprenyl-diphosphate synthase